MSDLNKADTLREGVVEILSPMRVQAQLLQTQDLTPGARRVADLLSASIELLWDRLGTDVSTWSVAMTATIVDKTNTLEQQIRETLTPEDKANDSED
ncbi:MAG: hypothetical protein NT005_02820 [Spirochaetes bacterium]|nr:hypothetical protein [Spirochaetota bacterium]